MNMRPVRAEVFHVDGQADRRTEMTKLTVAFRNFANAPKSGVAHARALRNTNSIK